MLAKLLTMSLDDIPPIIEYGLLPSHQYLKAVSLLRDGDFWKDWAVRALFVIAVGHILSGIIFFFAFNWNDLSGMTKFTIVGGGIVACLMAWILAKLDSPAGHAFGIGSTVLVGVMYAVLGQVYQTPAMIHTPFVFWAILTFPFTMASRNLAHWTVWLTILIVAIAAYSNTGLRLAENHFAANMLNIAVSGGLILALIILDKILAPRLVWTRAEWFRVLFVLAIISFSFIGFTESFWDTGNWLWLLALGLICGLLAYLYYFKPSLGTLALASFSVFTLVAQFGFKLFEKLDSTTSFVGVFFLLSLWMFGLSLGLIKAFRHFLTLSKSQQNITALKGGGRHVSFVMSLAEFCEQIGLEESGVSNVLTSNIRRDNRWYMELFLAISGVLTAVLCGAFFASILFISMQIKDLDFLGFLGSLVFGLSIVLRRKAESPYLKHMLNTVIIAGVFLTSIGFGAKLNNFESFIALPFTLSLIVITLVRDRILEFLSAGAIISLIGVELYHLKVPMVESIILVFATVLGVILLTHPIAKRVYKAAGTAFLLAPPILGIALTHTQGWEGIADVLRYSDDWIARVISFIVLLSCVVYLNKGKTIAKFNPPKAVLFPLLIGAAVVPLGGASALLLMLAGYIFGSRALTTIGMLLQIYFLTMFYYDLSLGLLTKSIVLFLSGLLFLGLWSFVRQKSEIQV
jgi:hypothetical protein